MTYWGVKDDIYSAIQVLTPDSKLDHNNRMLLVRFLATASRHQEALKVIDHAEKLLSSSPKDIPKKEEVADLRSAIEEDYREQQNKLEQIE